MSQGTGFRPAETIASTRARRGTAVRLALGTASALGLARFAYGLILPAMRAELSWSLAQAGGLNTANALGYLLGALIAAPVARRVGLAATFRLGLALTAIALAATTATGSYPVLLAARAAAGLSGALVFITGGVIVSRIAASTRSAAPITIYYSGAGIGIVFSAAFIPPLLDHHPGRWPLAWAGLAAVVGLAGLLSWTAAQDGGDGDATSATTLRATAHLSRPAAAYLLFAAGYIAYITFLSVYLNAHHASIAQVVLTWALLGLAAVIAPALWSRPFSKWPGTRRLTVPLALLSAASAAALIPVPLFAVTASAVGYGATFLAVPAAITTLIRSATPASQWTSTLATFTVIFAIGQVCGPYLAGALADHYGAGATLVWAAALCAAGAMLSASSRAKHD
ncbi:MAG TPA: YbfB/YjiJ family MFS transporter [Streptosporangiaceae bacterium]|nr:YbfB/YjiJ family MFS transporter [Streptosporangiaceae bacterium]